MVHATPSLQGGVPGRQPPVGSQVSTPLQYSPSSHAALLGVWSQESVCSLQESKVQAMPSSQLGGVPGRQPAVGSQVSTPLQYSPSSHAALLGVWSQESVCSLQESKVQAMPSSQLGGAPGTQPTVGLHVSTPLQY